VQLLMRVKICGLCRPEDALLAAEAGADYAGVILAPGGPRTRSESAAESIWAAAGAVARAGVFVDPDVDDAIGMAERLGLAVVQLHGDETQAMVARLRAAGPWRVWKAVRPRTGQDFADAARLWSGRVDGLLVDGFAEHARGGTGERFPWFEVAQHRAALDADTALIVAGGLSPDNVAAAIECLAPDAVDVSSGVEATRGVKSEQKLRSFIEAARIARPGMEEAGKHG
jgi:phosphoribosylanthranilate isomerase